MKKLVSLVIYIFSLFLILPSCDYNKTSFDLTSIFEPTLDFSETSNFTFDENFVEVKDGKAQLKPLDLEYSGVDFNNGNYVGTFSNSERLKLNDGSVSSSHGATTVLSGKVSDLVGYWSLNGNFADTSTFSNHGLAQGTPSFSSIAKVGNGALSQDGVDDFFTIEDTLSLSLNNLSSCLWVRPTSLSNDSTLLAKLPGIYEPYRFVLRSTGGLQMQISSSDGAREFLSTDGGIISLNQWSHTCFIFDTLTREGKIYLNGSLYAMKTFASGVVRVTNGRINIGGHESRTNQNMNGIIDEVSLWKTALTADEVRNLYERQSNHFTELNSLWTPHWDNIVGYWKMDGNWQDSSGNQIHGTAQDTATHVTDSKVGSQSGLFDGSNDAIDLGETALLDFQGNFSISTWVKTAANGSLKNIFSKWDAGANEKSYRLFKNSSDKLSFLLSTDGVTNSIQVNSVMTINLDSWTHVGLTYDNSEIKLYINGKLDKTEAFSGIIFTGTTENYIIGAEVEGGYSSSWEGNIDDLAVWNTSLLHSDMKNIYNRQKQKYAGHYDSEVIDLGSTNSHWPDLSWSTSLPFGKELVGDFDSDGNSDIESSSDYFSVSENLNQDLVGYWPLNERNFNSISGNDFEDKSKNNNHGNEAGGVNLNAQGIAGSAIELSGANFIEMPDSLEYSFTENQFTVSVWFKASPQTEKVIFSQYDTGASDRSWSILTGGVGLTDKVRFIVSSDGLWNSGSTKDFTSSIITQDQLFHNAVLTFDKGLMKIYIDGVEDTAYTIIYNASISSIHDGSTNLALGARFSNGAPGNFLNGTLDEAAIWSRALTPTEVQQLYRRGANRIKFQVKSCVDSTCECKSFSTSPAGNAADCDGDTIVNALDFNDLHKAEFIGPGGDGTTYYSEAFNRKGTDTLFNCGNNTTDSDGNICVDDEISFSGGQKPTKPVFDFTDFPLSAKPLNNQYIQYRVYMEADSNTACDGSPCLPELTGVNLNPNGETRYYGSVQEITSVKPIVYKTLKAAKVIADDCVSFQLSPDGTNYYYWSSNNWAPATAQTQSSSQLDFENYISNYSEQFGEGQLYIKALLQTNSNQSSNCAIQSIDIDQ